MKPSMITVITAWLTCPLLTWARDVLTGKFAGMQVARMEAKIMRIHGWIDREEEHHDEHMALLRIELAQCMETLQVNRMRHRLVGVKRNMNAGAAS